MLSAGPMQSNISLLWLSQLKGRSRIWLQIFSIRGESPWVSVRVSGPGITPLQIACWKSAPALACGNAMIFKPSEETPLGAIKLAEIFIEAGVPPGVFNVVQGAAEVGQWLTHNPVIAKKGFFVAPTIFADCTDDMTIVREEIFGPVMSILIFSYDEEVIARANNVDTGLAAGIFTLDIQRAHHVTHKLEAGICWINRYGLSPVEMPVGGNKLSGIGRENGRVTLDHYTELKSVYVGMSPIESSF